MDEDTQEGNGEKYGNDKSCFDGSAREQRSRSRKVCCVVGMCVICGITLLFSQRQAEQSMLVIY